MLLLSSARTILMLAGAGLAALPAFANPQLPPDQGPWNSGDYVDAIFAVRNGAITLPRRGNPKTEAFFGRMIDHGNIDRLMAGPENLAEKRQQILLILAATGEFRGRYAYAVALGDDLEGELVDVQIFRLALIGRLALLADPEACCDAAAATALTGTLDTLAEIDVFPGDKLIVLARALAAVYPLIRPRLSRPDQRAIDGRLGRLAAQVRDPAIKAALQAAASGN